MVLNIIMDHQLLSIKKIQNVFVWCAFGINWINLPDNPTNRLHHIPADHNGSINIFVLYIFVLLILYNICVWSGFYRLSSGDTTVKKSTFIYSTTTQMSSLIQNQSFHTFLPTKVKSSRHAKEQQTITLAWGLCPGQMGPCSLSF